MATKVAKILTTIVLQSFKRKKKKDQFFSTTTTTTFDLHAQKTLKRKGWFDTSSKNKLKKA